MADPASVVSSSKGGGVVVVDPAAVVSSSKGEVVRSFYGWGEGDSSNL